MKTIILCGGKGTRLHQETDFKPKPMVMIGNMPILLHIMKIYATFGHDEFVLCLGYKGQMIKEYFLHLGDYSNDFEFDLTMNTMKLLRKPLDIPYKITFVETGEETQSGLRVKMAAEYIEDDTFMVTYGDGVANIDIPSLVNTFHKHHQTLNTVATITATHPSSKYGKVVSDKDSRIIRFDEKPVLKDYINGGFMVFDKRAIHYIQGDEMLEDSLRRMTQDRVLSQYTHEGFWHSMDTMKDVIELNTLWEKDCPWMVWNNKKTVIPQEQFQTTVTI